MALRSRLAAATAAPRMEIEISWHPRLGRDGRPYALAVHVSYSMGGDVHSSEATTIWGAAGLDATPLSIFDIINMAIEEADMARALMLASTAGRLAPCGRSLH